MLSLVIAYEKGLIGGLVYVLKKRWQEVGKPDQNMGEAVGYTKEGHFHNCPHSCGFEVLEAERKAGTEVLLWSNVPQVLTRMVCPELVQVLTYVISDRD